MPSYTAGRGSTYRPATCSTRNGRSPTLFPEHEVQPFAGYKRWNQTTVGITRYIIGHSLKVQADMSYNHRSESFDPDYNRWEIRFQLELGL